MLAAFSRQKCAADAMSLAEVASAGFARSLAIFPVVTAFSWTFGVSPGSYKLFATPAVV
jgi:hypothetical protein